MGAGLWRKEYHEKAEGLVLTNGDIRILKRYLTGFKPGDVVELDVVMKGAKGLIPSPPITKGG